MSRITTPDFVIIGNWVFEKFLLANEAFDKALQILETCVSVSNDLCGKLVLSLQFPILQYHFLFQVFTYLNCEFNIFVFNLLY